jgi:hypothetical protein
MARKFTIEDLLAQLDHSGQSEARLIADAIREVLEVEHPTDALGVAEEVVTELVDIGRRVRKEMRAMLAAADKEREADEYEEWAQAAPESVDTIHTDEEG